MILATLALLPLLCGDPAREAAELRSYDLQTLLVPYRSEFDLQVLPMRGGAANAEEEGERFDSGLVVELVRSLCAPEFEYEGRRLQEQEGALQVQAPLATQEKVARILSFLGTALGARSEIALDEIFLAEPLAKDPAPILSPEEAQKLLSGPGSRRSWKVGLRPGWAASASSVRAISFLSRWDVEIAQGAAIHDPYVETVPAGDSIVCSGAAAPGGMWLALLARNGESSGPKDHALEFYATVASETTPIPNAQPGSPSARSSGRVLQAGPRLWQSVPLTLHALALNTFLPDGKVLCLSSTVGVGEPRGTRLLFVRRASAPAAPVQGLALDPKAGAGRDLLLVDGGWLRPPSASSEGDLRGGGALPSGQNDEQVPLHFRLHGAGTDRARDLLQELSGCDVFDSRAWLVVARSPRSGEASALEPAVARLGAGAPLPQSFALELALRRGPTLVARASLALRSGIASTVVCGAEDELLWDWDVEVAQAAAVASPIFRASFEGLCARVRVDRDPSGAPQLELRGFGQVRGGEVRNLDPQVPTVGALNQALWERLSVEERVTLPADGPRKAVFGDSGGAGLLLEVTLTELR